MTPEQQAMDFNPDLENVSRERKLAELLMAKGFQQPQGQMISGYYVAPSFTQQMNPLASMLAGQAVGERADKKGLELATALRGRNAQDIQTYAQLQATDPAKAIQFGLSSQNPTLKALVIKDLETQKYGEGEIGTRRNIATGAMETIGKGNPKYRAPLQSDEGAFIVYRDPNDPTKVLQRTPKSLSPSDAARLADEGIGGYGAPMGGQPTVRTGMTQGQPAGQPNFAPSTLPTYQADPMLSPKQNRELAMEFIKKQGSNVINAKDSFDLMKSAGAILASNAPSSGFLSNALTTAGEAMNLPYGARKTESGADAQLKMLSGALTMKQPRFEGPQGVLDVILYQKLAGDLGNSNIPVESRLSTMKQMVNLQKKYYPAGDWESIETQMKDTGKVKLGPAKEVDFNSLPTGIR